MKDTQSNDKGSAIASVSAGDDFGVDIEKTDFLDVLREENRFLGTTRQYSLIHI
ncbi:MAG: hypothetical protein R3D60_03295 [Paracoccaceae bacterium]